MKNIKKNNKDRRPAWSKKLKDYIISQLAAYKKHKDIWTTVTDSQFTKNTGIPCLDPEIYNYNLFHMRCKRITDNKIALVRQEYHKEMGIIKWSDDKDRITGLSKLIDTLTKKIEEGDFDKDSTGTMASLVGQLRGLYEQVRKEVSADADREALSKSGTRILLTNPKNITVDAEHVSELMFIYRQEIGGLHNLDFKALNTEELKALRDVCQDIIEDRTNAIEEAEFTVEDEETE